MKKIIKSGISVLLCAVMMFGAAPLSGLTGALGEIADWLDRINLCTSASAATNTTYTSSNGLRYTLSDGYATVTGYSGTDTELVLDKVDGYDIVEIGEKAFAGISQLESVIISDSVNIIDIDAFRLCVSLKNVSMGNNVRSIGSFAFYSCHSLENIVIPDSITSVGEHVFEYCISLTNITIPGSISKIPSSLFYECSELKSVEICNGVTSIGNNAFYHCTSLTSISIPSGIINISQGAFGGCTKLANISIPDSVKTIGSGAFFGIINVVFSENMTASGSPWGALATNGFVDGFLVYEDSSKQMLLSCDKSATGNIVIPSSVTSVKQNAFLNCYYIESITIPESVIEIGNSAFKGVNNIYYSDSWYQNIMNQRGSPWDAKAANGYVENNLVYSDNSKTYLMSCNIFASGEIVIPDTVIKIKNQAFENCTEITEITISNSVTRIGQYTFTGCSGLKSIIIPDSVAVIEDYAFSDCTGLTSITIGSGVTNVNAEAFQGCKNIESISVDVNNTVYDSRNNCNALIQKENNRLIFGCKNTVSPDSITSIGAYAFYQCLSLENFTIPDSVVLIGGYAFSNTGLTSIEIPNSVEFIGDSTFSSCLFLESINIPDSITEIQDYLFAYDINLKHIIIPESVKTINRYAFQYCYDLQISIPDSVTEISTGALSGVKSVKCSKYLYDNVIDDKVNIDLQLYYDGYLVFADSKKEYLYYCLNDACGIITIPDSVTAIYDNAFENCSEITGIIIGANVSDIGEYVFYGCEKLDSIIVDNRNPVFDSRNNCNAIIISDKNSLKFGCKNTSIPDSVVSIAPYAFAQCNGLTEVTIPEGVTFINNYAFANCKNLKTVSLSDSLEKIYSHAFSNCTSLSDVMFGNGLNYIGDYAFYKCSLINVSIPDSVTVIEKDAFEYCRFLNTLTLGKHVYRIGKNAFESCTNLRNITMSGSVKQIENHAFLLCGIKNINYLGTADDWIKLIKDLDSSANPKKQNCSISFIVDGEPLTEMVINSSIEKIPDDAFSNCKNITSFVISGNITDIGDYAFFNFTGLKSIEISNNVTTIGKNVFSGCTSLTSVTIPTSVTSIGKDAFYGINNIIYSDNWYNDVMHRQGSPWGAKAVDAYIENGLYYYDSSKELLLGGSPSLLGNVTIPDSVEEVGDNCFLGCDNIETLTFSSPVYFADTAVSGCDNLQSIVAPDNSDDFGIVYTKPVTDGSISTASFSTASVSNSSISIEYDTGILFCNRGASGDYTVPSRITHICEKAFANCKNVTVTIPDSVNLKHIGANAFLNSKDFNTGSKWSNNVLIIGNYIVASKATGLSGTYTVASEIKGIADRAFAGCSSLTGFNCGSNTRFLGKCAFSGCSSSLKNSLTFSAAENLSYIGEDLFDTSSETDTVKETKYYNNVLLSVSPDVEEFTIDSGTTVIAAGAFKGCTKLRSITVPDSIKTIDKDTFKGCINLSSVTLNSNINEIGQNAFADCISLAEITIPARVEDIGSLAFYGCTGMESFNVEDGNKNYQSVDGILMSKDGSIIIQYPAAKNGTEYSITNGVYVSDLAFYRCRKLQNISLADNVKLGNRNPFASCIADFNNGKYVFGDAKKTILKSVSASVTGEFTVPNTVVEIGSDAFRECTEITAIDFSNARKINKIGDYAFYSCTGLTSISIPKTVKTIGASAFENCLKLQEVKFENNVASGNYTLASIGDYAFCNCPCNAEGGSCNKDILKAEKLEIGKNAFSNSFADSVNTDENGLIYCIHPDLDGIYKYVDMDYHISASKNTERIGTGSQITISSKDNLDIPYLEASYTAVVFGDVNGDGWYDGMDAIMVSCLANGMLKKEDVSEAVYTAADCNHDGVIDNLDVEILQQAGVLLADVDQSKSNKELLETSSAYVEYLNLINQTVDEETEEITDEAPADETTPETSKTLFDILKEIVMKIINYIILNFSILKLK